MVTVEDTIRNLILDGIESGLYPAGGKLPGARELAAQHGLSFPMVQRAMSSLAQNGLVESVARRGVFVKDNWRDRLAANHLVLFSTTRPWVPEFGEILGQSIPQLRLCRAFTRGVFEVRTTYTLQRDRDQYMDLAPVFKRAVADPEALYRHPFQGFREADGRLFGIPIIFSPRLVFCNTRILKENGLPVPPPDWAWRDFLEYIRVLRRKHPDNEVLNYDASPFWWMNIFLRAGGKLLDRTEDKRLVFRLDTPETFYALRILRELHQVLRPRKRRVNGGAAHFDKGRLAFSISDREYYSMLKNAEFDEWTLLPLPTIPGGKNVTAQASDLICIRKECADEGLAEEFVRFMLGPRIQNFFGEKCYGIPIRREAAEQSFARSDGRDHLFQREMRNVSTEYNIDSSEISEIIYYNMAKFIRDPEPLERNMANFTQAVNLLLEVRNEMIVDKYWS